MFTDYEQDLSMFCKKRAKPPSNAFIPMPKRVLAIIQLCLAFSLLLWYGMQPFMGEYFSLRSQMLPYEYVMGTSDLLKKRGSEEEEKLQRNKVRFQKLPTSTQSLLLQDYNQIQRQAARPTLQKLGEGFYSLFFLTPSFELAWIVLAATLSILLLLKMEGAQQACWLLPLLVFFFAIDHYQRSRPWSSNQEEMLFPTEQQVIQNYLEEPLKNSPLDQHQQLQKAWNSYLVHQWSKQTPSSNEKEFKRQAEEGEFYFTVARLEARHTQTSLSALSPLQIHPFWMALYIGWNLFFAWMMNRKIEDNMIKVDSKICIK